MADIKILGIEQTDGRQRLVTDADTVVGANIQGETGIRGNTGIQGIAGVTGYQGSTGIRGETGIQGIAGVTGYQGSTGIRGETGLSGGGGNTIDFLVNRGFDYSSNQEQINVQILVPWSSPQKLSNPASLPADFVRSVTWSPNEEVLSVASSSSIHFYQRINNKFVRMSNPATTPANPEHIEWSPNGEFVAVAHTSPPYVMIYQRSGMVLTKLSDPGILPPGAAYDAAWSPNGEFLAVAHASTPYITVYQRNGTTFTKLTNPTSLPTGTAQGVAWSSSGEFLAVAHVTSPYLTLYRWDLLLFTKLNDPSSLPTGNGKKVDWTPDEQFLAVLHSTSPYLTMYQRSDISFTKIPNPSSFPTTADGLANVDWSSDGRYLSVANYTGTTPPPSILLYERSGTTFTKLADPSSLPTTYSLSATWSPSNRFLAVGTLGGTPYLTIYETGGSVPSLQLLRATLLSPP